MKSQEQVSALHIPINNLTREEILTRLEDFLHEPKFHQIATVNPEFLLEAEKNKKFHDVLQSCDLRIADGFGIALAFLFKGQKLHCRFPGADLLETLLRMIDDRTLSVYLAIRKDGLSSYEEIKAALLKKYPNIQINGADIDPKNLDVSFFPSIGQTDSIVLCNFGAPQQEIFLHNLKDQNNIRIAMGVGGSFDYFTGKIQRAPRWLQNIGLEWLWRLIQQPKRFQRIWNAVIIFPFHVFFATIKK